MQVSAGDTAWMLGATALVFFMMPELALFYGGLVGEKNVIVTMAQSFVAIGVVSVLWIVVGYSLAFGPNHAGASVVSSTCCRDRSSSSLSFRPSSSFRFLKPCRNVHTLQVSSHTETSRSDGVSPDQRLVATVPRLQAGSPSSTSECKGSWRWRVRVRVICSRIKAISL